MPVPKNRSNSVRNIKYRAPSGKSRIRYRRRTSGMRHYCAVSGERLAGTHSVSGLTPSSRRPERPFGGRLSPSVMRRVLKLRTRLAQGLVNIGQVPIALLPYVKDALKKQ